MGSVRRFREPVAWVVFVVVVLLAAGAIALHTVASSADESWLAAAGAISERLYNPLSAIALTIVVGACVLWQPPTRHARALTFLAAWFALIATALVLVLGVIGLFGAGSVLGALIDLVGLITIALLPALSAWLLWRFRESARTGEAGLPDLRRARASVGLARDEPAEVIDDGQAEGDAPPVWQPGEASGAVWHRASDAAGGAPASERGGNPSQAAAPGGAWRPARPPAGGTAPLATPERQEPESRGPKGPGEDPPSA
ncbi:hypothetical protein [Naumannella huperziae]